MLAKSTAIVISVSVVALVVAAALQVPRESIAAIGAAAVAIAGAMQKVYSPASKDEDQP